MIDDEVDRDERVDPLGVTAERPHGVAHRREVDDGRHAGEILHEDARGAIRDLALGLAAVEAPGGDCLDVGLGDRAAVLEAQQVLEKDLHRDRERGDAR
jgi:hypothetical protein